MKKPIKPVKPYKPSEYKFERFNINLGINGELSISSFCKKAKVKEEDIFVFVEQRLTYDVLYLQKRIKNPNYENEMLVYTTRLEEYEKRLAEFEQENEFYEQSKRLKLEKQEKELLEKLKQKYETT